MSETKSPLYKSILPEVFRSMVLQLLAQNPTYSSHWTFNPSANPVFHFHNVQNPTTFTASTSSSQVQAPVISYLDYTKSPPTRLPASTLNPLLSTPNETTREIKVSQIMSLSASLASHFIQNKSQIPTLPTSFFIFYLFPFSHSDRIGPCTCQDVCLYHFLFQEEHFTDNYDSLTFFRFLLKCRLIPEAFFDHLPKKKKNSTFPSTYFFFSIRIFVCFMYADNNVWHIGIIFKNLLN